MVVIDGVGGGAIGEDGSWWTFVKEGPGYMRRREGRKSKSPVYWFRGGGRVILKKCDGGGTPGWVWG